MTPDPTGTLDARFSDPAAAPAPWAEVTGALARAELFWLATVRADGRPHVTPLIGVAEGAAVVFVTGQREQKARNLEHHRDVALCTGTNTWAEGLDVVVEGTAVRVDARDDLERLAAAYVAKYGEVWRFEVGDGVFDQGDHDPGLVFRVEPAKVLAFAKSPHGQTTFRLA